MVPMECNFVSIVSKSSIYLKVAIRYFIQILQYSYVTLYSLFKSIYNLAFYYKQIMNSVALSPNEVNSLIVIELNSNHEMNMFAAQYEPEYCGPPAQVMS